MAFINISVKKHKITPQDVATRNEPSESKAPVYNKGRHTFEWREVGVVGAGGDMRKDTYDRTDSGVVDNSEALEGYTLTQVRDHAPKGHDNTQHIDNFLTTCDKYSKEFMDLLGIDAAGLEDYDLAGVRTHVPLTHSNDYHDETFLTTCDKYTKSYMNLLGIDAATLSGKALGVGVDNIAFYDANGRVADVTKVRGTTVDSTNIGVDKLLAYDATSETLVYKTLTELVPALNTAGKLILTGSDQIGTKAGDLGELWSKATKLTTTDLEATEFDQPNKIPTLDASSFLTLSQVIGNVPGLNGTGKLILTQTGTRVADLSALWDKTTELVTSDFNDATFNVANGMIKLDASAKVPYGTVPEVGGTATFVVAASNSENKDKADYVCTGTDDQGKVMAAIGDLPANGGSIMLLEGTYTVDTNNDPIKINAVNNITLKGQGKGSRLCLDTGVSSNIIEVSNASGIVIKDLYVDGTTTAASEGDDLKQCGILFITVTDSKIRNVQSMSNKRHGINLFNASQRNIITSSICIGNTYDGILIYNSTHNILKGNITKDSTMNGIRASDNSNNTTIIENRSIGNGGHGLIIEAAESNTISGNICNANSNDCIQLWTASYNTVTGNSCCNGGNVGIRCAVNSERNTISGNIVYNNPMGVYISSGNYNVLFGNSCCANTPQYGIYATSEFLTISGNVCYYNAVSGIGIFVYGKNVLFSNTCCINAEHGLIVYQNLDFNTIVGNIVFSNTINGIYAYDTNYNTLVSNNCHLNQYCGIYTYTASNNTMSSNTITNSSQVWHSFEANMTIREDSDYNNIQRNTCRAGSGPRAPSYGINIKNSNCSENLVTNNDIYNDNYGVSSLNIAAGSGTVTTPGNRTA